MIVIRIYGVPNYTFSTVHRLGKKRMFSYDNSRLSFNKNMFLDYVQCAKNKMSIEGIRCECTFCHILPTDKIPVCGSPIFLFQKMCSKIENPTRVKRQEECGSKKHLTISWQNGSFFKSLQFFSKVLLLFFFLCVVHVCAT